LGHSIHTAGAIIPGVGPSAQGAGQSVARHRKERQEISYLFGGAKIPQIVLEHRISLDYAPHSKSIAEHRFHCTGMLKETGFIVRFEL
jgi:hypothetical protein